MTVRVVEPPQDSGEPIPREQFAYVEELLGKLAAAEWRAVRAEEAARFNAMLGIVILLSSSAIICLMSYLVWRQ
jgi:hypothetical protein